MMKDGLILLLRKLEERLPPPPRCHHVIHLKKSGNKTDGWTDRLALTINNNGEFITTFFQDGDFDVPVDLLVDDLILFVSMIKESNNEN